MGGLATLVPPFGNIMVPPWVPFSPQRPGFRDEEYDIDLPPVTVAAGVTSTGNVLPLDADADYFVRELWFIVLPGGAAVQPSDLRVRIRDGDGHMFTNDFCYANDLNGPLCPPWPIRAGATLIIDYQNQNQSANSITAQLVLRAHKRKICGNVAQPLPSTYKPMRFQYPGPGPGETHRDFAYSVAYDNFNVAPTPSTLLKFPIQTDNDADFLWRGLCGQWAGVNNQDTATFGNVAITFYDANNQPFSALNIPESWGGYYGEQRESILTNGGRITPQFPQVLIPRGGVVLVDVAFGTLVNRLRFALRGVKVYTQGACK